ncbi:zinc finger protein [Saccharopolyspora sp. MS10]|uniref:zinc finger protein n=1 Tax=Saccharopolyspora sp. MS10 TaxID=3385973 RepID=UPI0039A3616B
MAFGVFHGRGPVAYWRPVSGVRHAVDPGEPPHPGQARTALCGAELKITKASAEDWLAPTCAACWEVARALRDAAQRSAPAVRPRTK